MKRIALLLILASSAPAFADKAPPPKDSKADIKADYDMSCNAIKASGADAIKDKSERAKKLADYITSHLKTEEVRRLFASVGAMNPKDRGPALKKAAADAGYTG